MCGRYALRNIAQAERYFRVHGTPWQPAYNIPPTVTVPVVRIENGERAPYQMRWGFVPFFARGVPGSFSTHNARIETLLSSKMYAQAWKRGQRCLQPASGFYEWHLNEADEKAPYFIHLADRPIYAFAGIWDRSATPDESTVIESVTHVTMPANPLMARIHNTGNHPGRMPAILREEDEDVWLNGTPEQAFAVLQPYPADLMVAYQVSKRVNNARNDGEQLLEPIPSAGAPPAQ